jgi:hypothetical protein
MGRIQPRVVHAPVIEVRRTLGLGTGNTEHPVLPLVPVLRRLVDPVPRELFENENGREPRELLERGLERVDVMKDALGDGEIEQGGIVERLQGDLPEDRPFRRIRVDREHVVAFRRERKRELATAAADLEEAGGRRKQGLEELVEVHDGDGERRAGAADRRPRAAARR